FYKKEIQRIAAIMAAFLFLENKSDKSQGLGQSPKVLIGNLQCSLIRDCNCRKALETISKNSELLANSILQYKPSVIYFTLTVQARGNEHF
ncbi:MAG: hypothetical protein N2489_03840, partial [Clostridia bacterium]|nr:hypothetical protein [Clostridia bacterium]